MGWQKRNANSENQYRYLPTDKPPKGSFMIRGVSILWDLETIREMLLEYTRDVRETEKNA
jgi:hypothetical protein